jgi:hypothetical protein
MDMIALVRRARVQDVAQPDGDGGGGLGKAALAAAKGLSLEALLEMVRRGPARSCLPLLIAFIVFTCVCPCLPGRCFCVWLTG